MAKDFNPKMYLNGEINKNNCKHDLLLHSATDEGENACYYYKCVICGDIVVVSAYESNFENNRSVYLTSGLRKYDETFLKNIVTYLVHRYSEEESIDLVKFFDEYYEEISSILDYINKPTEKDTEIVQAKYRKLFKSVN